MVLLLISSSAIASHRILFTFGKIEVLQASDPTENKVWAFLRRGDFVNDQDLVLEAQHQASFQANLAVFSGCSSRPQPSSQARQLGSFSLCMLRGWYLPEQGSVWLEGTVFKKLSSPKLLPEQQAVLDASLRMNQ